MIKVEHKGRFKLIEIDDSYDSLVNTIKESFPDPHALLYWIDADGDPICISQQKDWDLLRRHQAKLSKLLFKTDQVQEPPTQPAMPAMPAQPAMHAMHAQPAEPTIQVHRPLQASAQAWEPSRVSVPRRIVLPRMNARFVKHITADDDAVYAPGTAFFKVWRMRNEGDLPWTMVELEFVSKLTGDQLGGPDKLLINQRVEVGAEVNVSVPLVAPMNDGEYCGYWKLTEQNKKFGQRIRVRIHVKTPAPASQRENALLDQLEGFEKARNTALLLIRRGSTTVDDVERVLNLQGIRQSI